MSHPDLQTATALTPRQMVGQFWQRMANFDLELARPDKIIVGEWLNVGVKRLVDSLVKRIVDHQEQIAIALMKQHIEEIELKVEEFGNGSYLAYPDTTDTLIALWDLHIYKSLQLKNPTVYSDYFPKWWPSHVNATTGLVEGDMIMTDYVDITDSYDEHYNRIVNNSFSDVYNGPNSKVYLKRDVEEFPYIIITGSPFQKILGRKDVEPDLNKGSYWRIDMVESSVLNHTKMYADIYIDVSDETNAYSALPAILHNDIIDYAIDAYFEAQFVQKSGIQTAKVARQEAAPVGPQQS